MLLENIKQNKVGELFENERLWFPNDPKNVRNYHAFTRDLITNEIFR